MEDYEYKPGHEVDSFAEYDIGFPASIVEEVIKYLHKNNPGILGNNKLCFDLMLDAGCGNGRITKMFASHFRSIIAFDISKAQVEKAKELFPVENIKYVVGRGEDMPADDNSVDLIFSLWAAEYMDMKKVSKECNRVLKSNGCATILGFDVVDLHHSVSNGRPMSHQTGIDLFNCYFRSLQQYMIDQNHADTEAFTRFSGVYDRVEGLNKERNDDLIFETRMSLAGFKQSFLCIPSYYEYHVKLREEKQTDPLEIFGEKLKKRWNVTHLSDEDVYVIATFSVYMICLTKKRNE